MKITFVAFYWISNSRATINCVGAWFALQGQLANVTLKPAAIYR